MSLPDEVLPSGAGAHVPPAAEGSYPIRPGNMVQPLIDGTPAFQRIGEAVEAARHSIWLTVAFFASDFRFPNGRGGLFDVLDRAIGRGIDVRVLFWRPNPESSGYGRAFPGTQADRAGLAARGSRVLIRWDRASDAFCQHQKSWLIDAGRPTETAFVGGVNLTATALGSPPRASAAPASRPADSACPSSGLSSRGGPVAAGGSLVRRPEPEQAPVAPVDPRWAENTSG